jgi:hypothetical protein
MTPEEQVEQQPGFIRWATSIESVQALAERGWDTMPAGQRFAVWISEEWHLADAGERRAYVCRHSTRNRCPQPIAAVMMRRKHVRLNPDAVRHQPWGYCGDHMFANWIEGDRVVHRRLVEIGGTP